MFLKHSLQYFLAKALSGLIGLITVLIFTRILSPSEYGTYSIVFSLVGFLYTICFQWLSLSFANFYEAKPEYLRRLVATVLQGFLISLILAMIGTLLIYQIYREINEIYILIPLLVIAYAWFEINLRVANSTTNTKSYGLLVTIKSILFIGLSMPLFYLINLKGIFIAFLISTSITPFIFMRHFWKNIYFFNVDRKLLKQFLSYGFPMAIYFSLTLAVNFSDRFIITLIKGKELAGQYSASYDLVMLSMGFIMTPLYLSVFPLMVSHFKKTNIPELNKMLNNYATWFFVIYGSVAVFYTIFAEDISNLLLGKNFRDYGSELLPIIAFGIFFNGLKIFFFDLAFQAQHKTKAQILPALISFLINIILNILWIDLYGVKGAAYAMLVSFIIGSAISFYMARDFFSSLEEIYSDVFKVSLVLTFLYTIGLFASPFYGFISKSFIFCAVYIFFIYYLNIGNIKYIKFIKRE